MPGRSRRSWRFRLTDILTAIANCRDFTAGMDRAAFRRDAKTIHAVVRNLEIIGEAARALPPWLTERHSEAWSDMIAMRNVLAHGYWSVDLDIIWSTVVEDLPRLERSVRGIIEAEQDVDD
jgi:uncharacterized protein with HEPN domain